MRNNNNNNNNKEKGKGKKRKGRVESLVSSKGNPELYDPTD